MAAHESRLLASLVGHCTDVEAARMPLFRTHWQCGQRHGSAHWRPICPKVSLVGGRSASQARLAHLVTEQRELTRTHPCDSAIYMLHRPEDYVCNRSPILTAGARNTPAWKHGRCERAGLCWSGQNSTKRSWYSVFPLSSNIVRRSWPLARFNPQYPQYWKHQTT